jgi:hypothetical protein
MTEQLKSCDCMNPAQIRVGKFSSQWIGVDEQRGRFGEVSIDQCLFCHRIWLHYFVEYEHLSQSGRWYRGIISEEIAPIITPENAVEILNNLEWHFYGGSYFFGRFGKGLKGNVDVS